MEVVEIEEVFQWIYTCRHEAAGSTCNSGNVLCWAYYLHTAPHTSLYCLMSHWHATENWEVLRVKKKKVWKFLCVMKRSSDQLCLIFHWSQDHSWLKCGCPSHPVQKFLHKVGPLSTSHFCVAGHFLNLWSSVEGLLSLSGTCNTDVRGNKRNFWKQDFC